jgi:hypothetical protein
MRDKQSGVTMVGWLIIIMIFGIFAMAAMRLVPVYMESLKVSSVLRSVKSEHEGNRPSSSDLRKSIKTRFNIESINIIEPGDVKITPGPNGSFRVRATYDHKTPFIGNLGLVVAVDHRVEIAR